ncbi:MAG: SIS domain-containing protein [Candidatus Omnitrophica bacterium]|nr:SIS domain-containing protein [Candidatus Omnitrophota bacterium]
MKIRDYLQRICRAILDVDDDAIEKGAALVREASSLGGKVMIAGNGASAAIASHVSVDLTKTAGVRAISFNDADLITCFSNDYGYEHWVEEALKAYACAGDLVILISSSGKSPNIVNAARQARSMGLKVITLSGFRPDNPLRRLGDLNLWTDSDEYNIIEAVHQSWLSSVVDSLAYELEKVKA